MNDSIFDGASTDDKTVISNKFCEFFVSNPKRIHDNVQAHENEYLSLIEPASTSMWLYPTNPNEVYSLIEKLEIRGESFVTNIFLFI